MKSLKLDLVDFWFFENALKYPNSGLITRARIHTAIQIGLQFELVIVSGFKLIRVGSLTGTNFFSFGLP